MKKAVTITLAFSTFLLWQVSLSSRMSKGTKQEGGNPYSFKIATEAWKDSIDQEIINQDWYKNQEGDTINGYQFDVKDLWKVLSTDPPSEYQYVPCRVGVFFGLEEKETGMEFTVFMKFYHLVVPINGYDPNNCDCKGDHFREGERFETFILSGAAVTRKFVVADTHDPIDPGVDSNYVCPDLARQWIEQWSEKINNLVVHDFMINGKALQGFVIDRQEMNYTLGRDTCAVASDNGQDIVDVVFVYHDRNNPDPEKKCPAQDHREVYTDFGVMFAGNSIETRNAQLIETEEDFSAPCPDTCVD